MNYIELINRFWVLNKEYLFTPNEKSLYFALLNKCNELGWKNPFNQSNGYLAMDSGMSERLIQEARNTLKQADLIDFKSGNGRRKATQYLIVESKKGCNNNTLSDTLSDTLSCKNIADNFKHKQKETKLNKNINPPTPLKREGDGFELSFEKAWELYERKGNKKTSMKKWENLKNHCREAALKHIPLYVQSTPDKQYRKNFETYLNQECWNDEILTKSTSMSLEDKQSSFTDKFLNKQKNGQSD